MIHKAKLEDKDRMVVVKFVSAYNAEAHRILAEHRLAPALYYASTESDEESMYGGRYMIVMDFVEDKLVVGHLSQPQFERVQEAINRLHENNLVFGDLRPPNILVKGEHVQMIGVDRKRKDSILLI
jgi:tRNA A-37 threonylcarbamoyl transferase component Bud32